MLFNFFNFLVHITFQLLPEPSLQQFAKLNLDQHSTALGRVSRKIHNEARVIQLISTKNTINTELVKFFSTAYV